MAEEKSLEEMLKEAQAKLKEYEELTAKQKAAIDNACSDAAKHKKDALDWQEKYKATLSEQEKKELETKQEREQMLSELNVLKSEKRIASYKSKLMEIGYDADTASNMASVLPEEVEDSFFEGQKAFLDAKTQAIKAEVLNQQPGLPSGTPPKPEDKDAAEVRAILQAAGIKE